jgi:hypothetical protein
MSPEGLSANAQAAYMREWRKTESGKIALATQRKRQRARQKALARLAARYYHDFLVMLNEELENEGVTDGT